MSTLRMSTLSVDILEVFFGLKCEEWAPLRLEEFQFYG